MDRTEVSHILGAIIILTILISYSQLIIGNISNLGTSLLFAVVIIAVNIGGKKLMANMLDLDVEHRMWTWNQWGMKREQHFEKPMPSGVILPLVFSIITGGVLKLMTLLTYESKAKTVRAAKRFGFYSYTELTDWHNALIGSAGIVATLALALIAYFSSAQTEALAGLAAGYAFCNMLPISNLDGSQIFFGSRVTYATLGILTIVFAVYALIFGI